MITYYPDLFDIEVNYEFGRARAKIKVDEYTFRMYTSMIYSSESPFKVKLQFNLIFT